MDPSIKGHQPEGAAQEELWADLGLPSRGTRLYDLVRDGFTPQLSYRQMLAGL